MYRWKDTTTQGFSVWALGNRVLLKTPESTAPNRLEDWRGTTTFECGGVLRISLICDLRERWRCRLKLDLPSLSWEMNAPYQAYGDPFSALHLELKDFKKQLQSWYLATDPEPSDSSPEHARIDRACRELEALFWETHINELPEEEDDGYAEAG